MSKPIIHVLTDTSALSNPSTEQVQPLLGWKNPSGDGAVAIGAQLYAIGGTGATPVQMITDATIIAGESPSTRGNIPTMSRMTVYDPVEDTFFPVAGLSIWAPTAADLESYSPYFVANLSFLHNGNTYDANKSLSAANVAAFSGIGGLVSAGPGEWAVSIEAAVSAQATVTRAAGGAGVRHVCRSLHFSLAAVAAQTIIYARVRDGAAGAGTILWSQGVVVPAGSNFTVALSGLNLVGSANTAMTFEWSGAPVATNFQTAGGSGYDAS